MDRDHSHWQNVSRGEEVTEAKFYLSFDFTGIRGDTYEEFVHNCKLAFGEQLGATIVARAMSNLAQHYTGQPTEAQAVQTVVNTLGAQEVPQQQYVPQQASRPQQQVSQAVPQPGFQQPAVGLPYPGDCAHGPKKFVPAGVSRNTGKAYGAFWSCQAPQGTPKCRS